MTDRIGQMDEGYFVSRLDILRWINHTLILNLQDIEELGSGSVYCQLIDSLYSGRVPMSKVNWRARLEYQFIHNYKLLQGVFDRLGIDKKIEINKLTKCKYQDNLEMIQWLKRYIELQGGPQQDYDPLGRRGQVVVELPSKKKSNNKQNTKKPPQNYFSNSHFRKSGIDDYTSTVGYSSVRKSHSPDHMLNLTLKTPMRQTFQLKDSNSHKKFWSKTQRNPLKSLRCQDGNKLNEIRTILRCQREDKEQLRQIYRLLTTEDILEEEEAEFI